jgi:hypothetical protein
MIFVLGMSHTINVLKAFSRDGLSLSLENWSRASSDGRFFEVKTKPGLVPNDTLKAFVVSHATGWGDVARLHTSADGRRSVTASNGYLQLLAPLESGQDDGIVFSFLNGNEHSVLSMVQHAVPYDFVLPGHPDLTLQDGAQPIAYDIVRRQMELALNPTIASLTMMRVCLPRMRVVHVLPPPPLESDERILKTPEVFKDLFQRFGISPLPLRVKYYLLAAAVLREALAAISVGVVNCPPAALQSNGSIKDEYAYKATHGNEAYGALVAGQLLEIAGY